ncbi:uncharacterized protein BT62DRAFT_979829 [Guyanagaster necrorhizus]|uniref:Uncharacterized protein n=1 Tax=Guyanagaster necrorhizus TaxID=856835 RepID=A0A9P7VWR3_9AGAR|nr:uncharacterized protein BT62DRAFT_979829 [Guyanagaster necrorhizus MCA 3950]KAG7448028.1 hypothetical protein BT62DRAFT_979829 [Guyanagaster necrorhizus MCA 3950]
MAMPPSIINVHTPSESFAIVHSITQESLEALYDKLSRKAHTAYHGSRVGPGWLKYEFNDSVWNLDDDSDYTIFVWRQQQSSDDQEASTSTAVPSISINNKTTPTPTLYLHNPSQSIPAPPEYRNAAYYLFHPSHISSRKSPSPRPHSTKSRKTKGSRRTNNSTLSDEDSGVPKFKREFEKFHSANGVRTVMGSIGPVQNVRMLLKSGYRHVYISRDFAKAHGFIPDDAAPGHYGYGGLVNIGTWPITLTPSSTASSHPNAPPPPPVPTSSKLNGVKKKSSSDGNQPTKTVTLITVYLSEEPHFDVVLGRSFFERRQIQTNPIDPTDIVCLDTGEKIECELIILKDGKGEIVTVT